MLGKMNPNISEEKDFGEKSNLPFVGEGCQAEATCYRPSFEPNLLNSDGFSYSMTIRPLPSPFEDTRTFVLSK